MSAPLLATDEELEQIVLGPDSIVWQRFGDVRVFAGAGYALLLQVAHPTVGAGVRDHSDFASDPFGRLLRTTDYLFLLVYGGRDAAAMGKRLRNLHKTIKGTNPDGSSYHALEPEAYAWVHATLIWAGIAAYQRFVGKLSRAEVERFYAEYRPLGRLVGVREDDLPPDWDGFRDYVETMIADRLVRHETVDKVVRVMGAPVPPLDSAPVRALWPLLRVPPSRVLRASTFGLLPPVLRERFGIPWGRLREAELRTYAAASRAAGPLLPSRLRNMGPPYLEWRAKPIARGPLGPGAAAGSSSGGSVAAARAA